MATMREVLRRNLGYKIVSLVLAIIFWLWITSQADSALFKDHAYVQLITRNQPSNMVIVSKIPPSITVRIDNPQGVSIEDLVAYVDLKDVTTPGEHTFQVMLDKKPEGVRIVSMSPGSVTLTLDLVKDKIIPVTALITGKPASGFTAGEPLITPSVVNVRGPASILDKLESAVVDVDISDRKENYRVPRPVRYEDTKGEGIFGSDPNLESLNSFPDTVEVIVPIFASELASKSVPLKVTAEGQPASGMELKMISPVPAQVQLLGDPEILKGIEYVNLGRVNIAGITANKTINIPLSSVTLPKGVAFSEGTKLSVLVYVEPSPISRTIKAVSVEIKNLAEGLTAKAITPIDITVKGSPSVLNALKPEDFSAWVDASGLQAGTHEGMDVYWNVPTGVSVISIPKVELILESKQ